MTFTTTLSLSTAPLMLEGGMKISVIGLSLSEIKNANPRPPPSSGRPLFICSLPINSDCFLLMTSVITPFCLFPLASFSLTLTLSPCNAPLKFSGRMRISTGKFSTFTNPVPERLISSTPLSVFSCICLSLFLNFSFLIFFEFFLPIIFLFW